jgi:hypothetical protein
MVHPPKAVTVRRISRRGRRVLTTLALVFGLSAVHTPASAAIITIDFNNLVPGPVAGAVPVGGGLLSYDVAGQAAFDIGGGNIVMVDVDPTDASGNAGLLSLVGGGTFNVLSIDIADLTDDPAGGGGIGGLNGFGFRIGLDPGDHAFSPTSSTFTTIDLSGLADFQNIATFAVNIVSFLPEDNFAIDNIVVEVQQVPEPAALVLLGLGALGIIRARHTRSMRQVE